MKEKKQEFKKPSKKHEPKGLTILYEDKEIIVVNKISGLLTISTDKEREKTAYFLLTDYVKKGNSQSKNRVFIVHRLDRDTSGVLVFAKTEKVKRFLQDNWNQFHKTYFAVVLGKFQEKEGEIISYLTENKAHVMYSTKNTLEGKLSKTGYKVLRESNKFSLLEIDLFTGRKNQIRVHMADKGHPVVGDNMYGNAGKSSKQLALHAASLTLLHPFTKEKMIFETPPPTYFNTLI